MGSNLWGNKPDSWTAAQPTPGSQNVNQDDIDLLMAEANSGNNNPAFDLTGDGLVTKADVDELVQNRIKTQYGDINLDGKVDFLIS